MAIYLKNVTYIDWYTMKFTQGNLKIDVSKDGGIQFIDSCPDEAYDATGKLITKSFVCAHHHAYSALARGMPPPKKEPKNFHQKLMYIWWHLDKNLDQGAIRASALVTALDCIKRGVTFVIDHHSSPYSIPDSLFTISKAFEETGINH